jgi:hypothetical protein
MEFHVWTLPPSHVFVGFLTLSLFVERFGSSEWIIYMVNVNDYVIGLDGTNLNWAYGDMSLVFSRHFRHRHRYRGLILTHIDQLPETLRRVPLRTVFPDATVADGDISASIGVITAYLTRGLQAPHESLNMEWRLNLHDTDAVTKWCRDFCDGHYPGMPRFLYT